MIDLDDLPVPPFTVAQGRELIEMLDSDDLQVVIDACDAIEYCGGCVITSDRNRVADCKRWVRNRTDGDV